MNHIVPTPMYDVKTINPFTLATQQVINTHKMVGMLDTSPVQAFDQTLSLCMWVWPESELWDYE